jgi:cold shock CspA family protein
MPPHRVIASYEYRSVHQGVQVNGVITSLINDRSFGFIRDARGTNFFFHVSGVADGSFEGLAVGSKVVFDEQESEGKDPRATNVRPAGDA